MNYTLRQLRTFVAVAREGSFTRAASALGMTQSSASLTVRQLEEQLGVALLERDTRNVRPTEAGRELAGRLEHLLGDLDDTLSALKERARRVRGMVRIAAVPSAAARMLPQVVVECRRRHPDMDLIVDDMAAADVVTSVAAGRADLGLMNETQDAATLMQIALGDDAFCLVCRRDDPLARKSGVVWTDIAGREVVMLDERTGSRALIDGILAEQGIAVHVAQKMSRPEAVAGMVAAGVGVAVLPELSAPDPEHPVLAVKLLSAPEASRRLIIVHRPDRPPAGAALTVTESLKRLYGA